MVVGSPGLINGKENVPLRAIGGLLLVQLGTASKYRSWWRQRSQHLGCNLARKTGPSEFSTFRHRRAQHDGLAVGD